MEMNSNKISLLFEVVCQKKWNKGSKNIELEVKDKYD